MSDENTVPEIEIRPNGPLIVRGIKTLRDATGNDVECESVVALCRCGGSGNKPFCDGTHKRIGFTGERETERPLDHTRPYQGGKITVHDNRAICAHAAYCVHDLPSAFDDKTKPWVKPDGASVEEVIALTDKCPSGALTYSIDGTHFTAAPEEDSITISKNGPYHVRGNFTLKTNPQPPVLNKYTLCRCGASKNKPYCDGAHNTIGFTDNQ